MKLKLHALIENEKGEVVVEQELEYSCQQVALHDAVKQMGTSFVFGLGVSLSSELLGPSPQKS